MARKKNPISRRRFLEGTGAVLAASTAAPALAAQRPTLPPAPPPFDSAQGRPAARTRIRLTINGVAQRIEVEDRWTLVEVLRDQRRPDRHQDRLRSRRVRRLHGAARRPAGVLLQPARGLGRRTQCPDGRRARTQRPAQSAAAGIRRPQRARSAASAPPGSSWRPPRSSRGIRVRAHAEVRAGMTGNLCRCSNYNAIVEAVLAASGGNEAERRRAMSAQSRSRLNR